jgi:hypothetical protein
VNKSATATDNNDKIPANTTEINDVAPSLTNLTFTIKKENGKIVLEHNLDNTMPDKVYHYFPYEITVQVTNPALPGNPEKIVFKQYPAMYVESVDQTKSVYINNQQQASGGKWWYVISSAISGPAINKITVSAFDSSTANYIICDPRAAAADLTLHDLHASSDTGANASNDITATDDAGDATLTGYRATIMGTASDNLVAPSFIMASSFGAYDGNTQNLYKETSAKYRCAAYQEAGYPAGRWRLPTPAELQVVARLCVEKKIANIFYSRLIYATSNGAYRYNDTTQTIDPVDEIPNSARCVYDIWYWKDKLANEHKSKFIWAAEGDMEENVGNKQQYFTTDVELK